MKPHHCLSDDKNRFRRGSSPPIWQKVSALYQGGVDLIAGRWKMMIRVEVIILKQTLHLYHSNVASYFRFAKDMK